MTIQELLDSGFKEYKNHFSQSDEKHFSKSITDDDGIRYSIFVRYFKHDDKEFFSPSVQFQNTPFGTVEIQGVQWFNTFEGLQMNNEHSLNTMYEYFDYMWKVHGKVYYEEY